MAGKGSWDQHYQCDTVSLGINGLYELESAFIDYLRGNNTWKARFEWKLLADPMPRTAEAGQEAAVGEFTEARFTALEEDVAELKKGMAELDRKLTTLIAALNMADEISIALEGRLILRSPNQGSGPG